MSLRDVINTRPKVAVGVALGIGIAGLLLAAIQVMAMNSAAKPGSRPERAFFTVDEGKTWFVGDAAQLAPFQHEGKEALRAYVAASNGKQFVNHLERYTPEGQKAMAKLREAVKKGPPPGMLVAAAQQRGREVRRPSDPKWTSCANGKAAIVIQTPKSPDGGGDAKFVFP